MDKSLLEVFENGAKLPNYYYQATKKASIYKGPAKRIVVIY